MKRGRPVLGSISGLFLGVFVALLLQQFGVWPLDNLSVFGFPLLGLVIGFLLGRAAPLGSGPPAQDVAPPAQDA